ncbi:LppM family (lipo)protein [Phytoactinopolyspora mesophila]|uniref:LppM domain-containing protein n=1 Tax=Phytoactinopolyspora mesophila TaxID=2650750 RepID=A0A7K3MAD8_9ACTN|nr:hypothetical protein [Phytoactinopolyspora mesophila]NDL60269.1 hypothetical protein [Phytoactinopolyspora mesophila]
MKRTRTLRAIGAAGLVLALTGCIKMDMDLTVNADDTVDGTMIFGFNKEMSDMMGEEADMFDGMMDELLDMDLGEDAPDDVTVEPYDDGTFIGQEMTFQGVALDEFGGDDATSELRLTREGDEFVFEGDMDMSDTGEMGDIPPGMLEGMMEFDMRVSITFPGEVLEHNGDLSGTTVTWVPEMGETNDMYARASESGGGGGMPVWLWIVIGVVVVAGLVALLFLFSRGKTEPAVAGDAPAPPPSPEGAGPVPPAPGGAGAAAAAAPPAAPVGEPAVDEAPAPQAAEPVDEPPAPADDVPLAAPGPDPSAAREPEAAPAPDAEPEGSAEPAPDADEAAGTGEQEEDR